MANKIMKTLTLGGNTYEIYDETARNNIASVENRMDELEEKSASGILVDTELSETSTNPVQNAVVTAKFSQLSDTVNDLKNNGSTGGGTVVSSVEPMDDDIPKVYFTGTLPTGKAEGELPLTIHYISKTEDFKHHATLKVQGDTSSGYAKKNFTLKMYEDEALENKVKYAFKDWGNLNKFVLKAHWIDHSHVRNVGCAKVWGNIVSSRSDYESLPEELRNAPNNGATDGFTVKVFVNGIYHGLYEWIVPKDKLFGQDGDNPNHSILNSERNNELTCAFSTTEPDVKTYWSEELQDNYSDSIATSFGNFIKFVAGSTDEEFVANAENYFDVQSVIDFDIFARVLLTMDSLCKNQIFFTYDVVKWYEGAWDMDSTLGLNSGGGLTIAYNTEFQKGYSAYSAFGITNKLYERIENLFTGRFKTRYFSLRESVLSIENIIEPFERLTDVIKSYDGLLEEDYAETTGGGAFTGIPSVETNNIQQIRNFIAQRLVYMDEVIANMGSEEEPDTPIEPEEPTVTLSSISATYNGGDVAVGTALTALTRITVTAHYSDGSTSNVTGYTLSGTIAEGNNTITVSYNGKTTTFIVIGVAEETTDNGIMDGVEWHVGSVPAYTGVPNADDNSVYTDAFSIEGLTHIYAICEPSVMNCRIVFYKDSIADSSTSRVNHFIGTVPTSTYGLIDCDVPSGSTHARLSIGVGVNNQSGFKSVTIRETEDSDEIVGYSEYTT